MLTVFQMPLEMNRHSLSPDLLQGGILEVHHDPPQPRETTDMKNDLRCHSQVTPGA